MSKFKLRQKVTIDGNRFTDKKPRKAVIAGIHSSLDTGLITFGLQHFYDTATEHDRYLVAYEVPTFNDQIRLVRSGDFNEDDLTKGWSK